MRLLGRIMSVHPRPGLPSAAAGTSPTNPLGPGDALVRPRDGPGVRLQQCAPRRSEKLRRGRRRGTGDQGPRVQYGVGFSRPRQPPRGVSPADLLPDRPGVQGRDRLESVQRRHRRHDGDLDGRTSAVSPRRHLRLQPQRPAAQAHRLSRSRLTQRHAVRAVHRFDDRERDLRCGTIPGAATERDRHLRDRLQPGFSPTATTTSPTSARFRHAKTTCRFQCARASA